MCISYVIIHVLGSSCGAEHIEWVAQYLSTERMSEPNMASSFTLNKDPAFSDP